MATVNATITWATHESRARKALDIECGEAMTLQFLMSAATLAADAWLDNLFEDADGADIPQPPAIEGGVYAWMHAVRALVGITGITPGLTSVKTGDLTEGFANSNITAIAAGDAGARAAAPFWGTKAQAIWR